MMVTGLIERSVGCGAAPLAPAFELLEQFQIRAEADVTYARVTLRNLFRASAVMDGESLILAAMELATNLLKHAGWGQLLCLRQAGVIYIAATDRGPGMINPQLALSKGYSTCKGSLGLGLYALTQMTGWRLDLFSCRDYKNVGSGTVALFGPDQSLPSWGFASFPLDRNGCNGDFFAHRDGVYMLGDAAGHGPVAQHSADAVLDLFHAWRFTPKATNSDDFLCAAARMIEERGLRSTVLALFRPGAGWQCEVVGNVTATAAWGGYSEQHNGNSSMLGLGQYRIDRNCIAAGRASTLFAVTDGIHWSAVQPLALQRLATLQHPLLTALAVHTLYGLPGDDCSVLILKPPGGAA